MTLDWLYEGTNVGFMIAHEKGFYRDAGLDVAIAAGKGSAATAQLVASKASQLGFADGFVVGNGISKGMNLRTLGSIFRRNPAAIIVFDDSPIKSPKDLEGKKIGLSAGSAVIQQWPAFCKGAGVDAIKVEIDNVDPTGLAPALITGKIDALAVYVSSYVPPLEIRGKKSVRIFWFADYGVTVVSNGIIAHNDLIKSDPTLIRAFVPASIKGFLYGRQHPDEAIAVVKKYQPTVDAAIMKRGLEVSWELWVTPNTRGKPLGWGSEADWTSTIQVLHQYGGVTTPLKASELYTNEYVPTGAEFIPPQKA
ncbi:MAG TPA: ABC transporter substrate-binding protein [Xanthobacteraceae bacterium]|jgi:NitT/TauT family transport system substrate-binding protein